MKKIKDCDNCENGGTFVVADVCNSCKVARTEDMIRIADATPSGWIPKVTENKIEKNCATCGSEGNCRNACMEVYVELSRTYERTHWTPKNSEQKGVNPKDAIGAAKNPHGCVSRAVLAEVGLAMMEGSRKYGRHNYRVAPVRAEVYFDACNRHLDAWWEGEDIDADSGLPHLIKAIACLFVIRDAIICDSWYDDRPPKIPVEHRNSIKKRVAEIIEKFPESKPPYIENDHGKIYHPRHSGYCPECREAILKAKQGEAVPICSKCVEVPSGV